jgi:hypothetical protein
MTLAGSSTFYKCLSDKACPYSTELGDGLSCLHGGTGIACASCIEDYRWDPVGQHCVECNDRAVLFFVLCGVFFLFFVFLLIPKDPALPAQLKAIFVTNSNLVPLYQLADLLQYVMLLGASRIPWPERSREYMQRIGGFFDLSFYYLDCKGSDDREEAALSAVIGSNLIPVILYVVIILITLPSNFNKEAPLPSALMGVNMLHSIYSAFFQTIAYFGFAVAFQTYNHPHAIGFESETPEASLKNFPFLLVGSSKVDDMRTVSVIFLSLHVLFLFLIPYHIIRRSAKKKNATGPLRLSTLSLVVKYHESMSWWHFFDMLFKLLTVLSITGWNHDPTWEFRALSFLALLQLVLIFWWRPYRYAPHNWGEEFVMVFKVLLLANAMPSFDDSAEDKEWNDGRVVFFISLGIYLMYLGVITSFIRIGIQDVKAPPHGNRWDPSEGFDKEILCPEVDEVPLTEEEEAAQEAAAAETAKEEKVEIGQIALMSLRFKHATVLWTLAAHWTKNRAGHVECKTVKEYQQKIIQRLKEGIDIRDLPLMLDLNEQMYLNVVREVGR